MLISRCSLITKWIAYCNNLKKFNIKTNELGIAEEKHKSVIGAIDNITKKIMNDDLVQTCLNNLLNLRKQYLVGNDCSSVCSEFIQYIKNVLVNLDRLIQDKPNSDTMYKSIKINSLFVLQSYLFGTSDKKIFKNLIELNTKVITKNMYKI